MSFDEVLKKMTLRQKVCQMLLPAFRYWVPGAPGNIPVRTMARMLGERHFGGVIVFDGNIVSLEDISDFMRLVEEENTSTGGVPYMFAIDQEGGRVSRLVGGTRLAGNMALGAAGDGTLAFEAGRVIGTELSEVGFDLDFAPAMDVNDNPANPAIGVRSFSDDPVLVSRLGCSFMKGLQSHGVMAVAKHFPGHGNTVVDSHIGLPVVDKSLDELRRTELVPFEAAVGVADMIMTAHIQFPQVERETYVSRETGENVFLPATLSKTFITGILREGMGYDGVVITDDMCMGAIARHFDPLDAAALAIKAGADILLMPVNLSEPEGFKAIDEYIDGIVDMVGKGGIPLSRIDGSVGRILTLKGRYPKIHRPDGKSGWTEHGVFAWDCAQKAVTLLRNRGGLLPLSDQKTLVICPSSSAVKAVEGALDLIGSGNRVGVFQDGCGDVVADGYEVCIVVSESRTVARIPDGFEGRTVFVSSALPYDVVSATDYDAVLACYGYDGGPNLPACICTIFGNCKPGGRLPVDITDPEGKVVWKRGFRLD